MTSITETTGTGSDIEPLRAKWGWIVALGIVYIVAGFVALSSILAATVVSVFIVGIMMIVAGLAEVIGAFQVKGWGKFLLWALLGILYIVAGFVTFQNPLLAAALLTLILGVALIASGVMRIVLAFSVQREAPRIWVLLSGVVKIALGALIFSRWSVWGLYIHGYIICVDLTI